VDCYILRYAEIGLKSDQTRRRWLEILRENIQRGLFLDEVEFDDLAIVQGRLILYTNDERASSTLKRSFGVVSFSPAEEIDADLEAIGRASEELYKKENLKTFRVSTQRVTKDFPLTSMELNCCVGDIICKCGGRVDLESYELNIGIELIKGKAYIFHETFEGPGGIPYGVQGTGCSVIRDFRDFLSCLLFMKRGCEVVLIVLNSPMAANYIDLLQSYAFRGLRILLVDEAWQLKKAMEKYMDEGIEVFISAEPLDVPPESVNICPTELYTQSMAHDSLKACNIEKMPRPLTDHKISAGCVVLYRDTVLLLRRKEEKTWVLPKGGVDSLEFFREAALRETCEESGICSLEISEHIGKTRYSASDIHGPFTKDVYYYLSHSKKNKVVLEHLFDSYTFLPMVEALELISFESDKRVLMRAQRYLKHIKRNV